MPTILHTAQILSRLEKEVSECNNSLVLISAYGKLEAIRHLDTFIKNRCITKILILRFRLVDVISGATDLNLYPYCSENGWTVYFNMDLHAKLYLFDNRHFLIGSANATNSGLNIGKYGNYEMAVVEDADDKDIKSIQRLIDNSTQLTDILYSKMKEYIDSIQSDIPKSFLKEWPHDVLFPPEPTDFSCLSLNDFPPCESPFKNQAALTFLNLHLDADHDEIIQAFSRTKGYQWLVELLRNADDNKKRFGEVKERMRDKMGPAVHNKELTKALHNFQEWIKVLNPSDITVYLFDPNGRSHIFKYIGGK